MGTKENYESMKEMLETCGCENCKDKNKCNGVDLMNCYAMKKMSIKVS